MAIARRTLLLAPLSMALWQEPTTSLFTPKLDSLCWNAERHAFRANPQKQTVSIPQDRLSLCRTLEIHILEQPEESKNAEEEQSNPSHCLLTHGGSKKERNDKRDRGIVRTANHLKRSHPEYSSLALRKHKTAIQAVLKALEKRLTKIFVLTHTLLLASAPWCSCEPFPLAP